jgi:hypothetical protein
VWRIVWRVAASAGVLVLVWLVILLIARFALGEEALTPGILLGFIIAGACIYGMAWTLGWIWTPFMHPPRAHDEAVE